jgi:hypothetical protein
MEEDRFTKAKRAEGTAAAGGWRPGVGQLVGLVIAAIFFLAAIILGVTTGVGLLVLVMAGLFVVVLLLVLLRGGRRGAAGTCPHCGAAFNFPSHISEFNCPSCGRRLESR